MVFISGAFLLIVASTAAANPKVLTVGALGGEEAAVADALQGETAAGGKATFVSAIGNVTCNVSRLNSVVSANPEIGGGAKTATLSVFNWSFENCGSTIAGVTGATVTVRELNYVMSISNAAGFPIVIKKLNGNLKLEFEIVLAFGAENLVCTYRSAEMKGAFENAGNKIVIANQGMAKIGGAFCPAAFNLSVTYTPFEDITYNPAKAVFVN